MAVLLHHHITTAVSYHIIWICYGAPIRSSEAPNKVQYRLNSTTNRWYGYKMQC